MAQKTAYKMKNVEVRIPIFAVEDTGMHEDELISLLLWSVRELQDGEEVLISGLRDHWISSNSLNGKKGRVVSSCNSKNGEICLKFQNWFESAYSYLYKYEPELMKMILN